MKLTNRKIINDVGLLLKLSNIQLPVRTSYVISRNIKKIEKELEIYNEERQKLLDKYAEKNEDGSLKVDENDQLKIPNENLKAWNKDINELLDIEIDIDIHKFNIKDLLNSNCEITANELILIDYMIEE